MTVAKRFRASFLHSVPTQGVETLLLVCPAKSTGALVAYGPVCSQVRGSTLGEESQADQGTFITYQGPCSQTHTHTNCVSLQEKCPWSVLTPNSRLNGSDIIFDQSMSLDMRTKSSEALPEETDSI